jgi:hypothetical protein
VTVSESVSPATGAAPVVYRLQARLMDTRILVLEEIPHMRLHRWLKAPPAEEPPAGLSAAWTDEPRKRKLEFPSFAVDAPIFTRRSLEVLGPELAPGGRFLPVTVEGTDDEYALYLVEHVVDCLDVQRSSKPSRITQYIKQAVFRPDRLPDLPAFRVPESPTVVYWTRAFADRVVEVVGPDVEALVVWSLDPSRPVDPNAYPR